MAGVAGNVYTLALAKQSAKGTAASASSGYKLKLTNGDFGPSRKLLTLQETDASRQQGATVVVGADIEGQPEWYVRPADFGLIAYAALGSITTAGGSHVVTPAQAPPYLTAWKNIGIGTLVDRYTDVRVAALEISGGAGQAIACKADLMGLNATFGAADNTMAVVSDAVYTYPEARVTLGGVSPGTVEQFSLSINNNAEFIQADNSVTPYDIVLGRLEVSGSFTILFESDADYRKFHTGSASGTAFSTTLFEETLNIRLSNVLNGGTDSINFDLAGIAFTAYPVPPDTSGKPIRVAATFTSLPQAAIADYLKISVGNSVVSY